MDIYHLPRSPETRKTRAAKQVRREGLHPWELQITRSVVNGRPLGRSSHSLGKVGFEPTMNIIQQNEKWTDVTLSLIKPYRLL